MSLWRNVLFGYTDIKAVSDDDLLELMRGQIRMCGFSVFYKPPDYDVFCMARNEIQRRREARLKEIL